MRTTFDAPLAAYTTLRLGGSARRLREVSESVEVIEAVRSVDAAKEPERLLVIGGGSNLVLPDAGFEGTVVLLRTTGFQARPDASGDEVEVTATAGQDWDALVAWSVAEGLSGIECLSGIPGSVGATPIQNVGAYGQEVAETIKLVRAWDRKTDKTVELSPADCGFRYRHSVLKGHDRWVVLSVTYGLRRSARSCPLRFGELTRVLGVEPGESAPLEDVRAAVLKLRAGKGMVLDADDHDTWSVGSFFTNPIISAGAYDELAATCASRFGAETVPPLFPDGERVKTSAAWLIERAGFGKGYGRDGVSLSTKHTLALTNRGDGTSDALLSLAREVRDGVRGAFGITLVNEPVLVDTAL